ncbi:hypothetical protein [Paraburkholderia sediminicola]|uniref:hypothetical protein n=1 Tax=Paraburkholderia sediminicola TaxID=458836 RepID=UPI0038BDB4C3
MSTSPDTNWQDTRPESIRVTSMHANAFWVIGATTRDDRPKIVELAEARSLESGSDEAQKARAALTNPKRRLAQEVSWLPGVAPKKASQAVASVEERGLAVAYDEGLPPLARANLTAAAFELAQDLTPHQMAALAIKLAELVEAIDPATTLLDINEDRAVAGFPEVLDEAAVETELGDRRTAYKSAIKGALDRMESSRLVESMVLMVRQATDEGRTPALPLIDDLVDAYALEVEPILSARAERIALEIQSAIDFAPQGKAKVSIAISSIEEMSRAWCAIAKPVQLNAKARGTTDQSSFGLGAKIRSLGITLNNEHSMIELAERTTALVRELFADLPELAEIAGIDAEKLLEIKQSAIDTKRQEDEWESSITFRSEVGLLFKDALSIGPEGIQWKGRTFPLSSITALRWGGVRKSVNGIPTGTDYKIGIGTENGSTLIELKRETTYTKFLDCLWRAVCVRLIVEMTQALKAGKTLSFGSIEVSDTHAHLVRSKLFGFGDPVTLDWGHVHIWSANGKVVMASRDDKKVSGTASYIDHWNAHILEHVVRGAFKKGVGKLSDYLT